MWLSLRLKKNFHITVRFSRLDFFFIILLATAAFLLPLGRLSDLIGRKKTFQIGLIIFSFFSFSCGFAPNVQILIILRILQGLGAAMIFSTSNAIITSVFPQGERGRAMGLAVTGVYLGLTLGPLLGGIITHNAGWRTIFFLNLPVGIFLSYLTYTKLPGEWAEAKGEKFDLLGSLLYAIGLVLLMVGFSKIQTHYGKIFPLFQLFYLLFLFLSKTKLTIQF
jgi:Arabinose efflux permease